MTITTDTDEWSELSENTPRNAINVKLNPKLDGASPAADSFRSCGRLCKPPLVTGGKVDSDAKLYKAVAGAREVVVIGHGYTEKEQFVWRGTVAEFTQTWIGD